MWTSQRAQCECVLWCTMLLQKKKKKKIHLKMNLTRIKMLWLHSSWLFWQFCSIFVKIIPMSCIPEYHNVCIHVLKILNSILIFIFTYLWGYCFKSFANLIATTTSELLQNVIQIHVGLNKFNHEDGLKTHSINSRHLLSLNKQSTCMPSCQCSNRCSATHAKEL